MWHPSPSERPPHALGKLEASPPTKQSVFYVCHWNKYSNRISTWSTAIMEINFHNIDIEYSNQKAILMSKLSFPKPIGIWCNRERADSYLVITLHELSTSSQLLQSHSHSLKETVKNDLWAGFKARTWSYISSFLIWINKARLTRNLIRLKQKLKCIPMKFDLFYQFCVLPFKIYWKREY